MARHHSRRMKRHAPHTQPTPFAKPKHKSDANSFPVYLCLPSFQSILKRVTSRVSQWFSPAPGGGSGNTSPNSSPLDQLQAQQGSDAEDATSREFNGHHRRRCTDIISPEAAVEEAKTQPPLKRSKTTIVEVSNPEQVEDVEIPTNPCFSSTLYLPGASHGATQL